MEAGSVFIKIGADMSEFNRSMSGVQGKLGNLKTSFAKFAKTGAVVTGAVAAAGGAMLGMATKAADTTDRIDKMSQKLGMSREGFQEWDFILSQSGASIESLQGGMTRMTSSIDDLRSGSKTAVDSFSRIGLELSDLQGLSQEDAFMTIVMQLQDVSDETERAALAQDILGRSSAELAPLLNAGADSLIDMKEQAHELGLVMGDDAIDAGVKFTDTMDQLKRSFNTVFAAVGVELMPVIEAFSDFIIRNMPTIQRIVGMVFNAISDVVTTFVDVIKMAIDWVSQFVGENRSGFTEIWQTIKKYFGMAMDFIEDVLGKVREFVGEQLSKITDFWDENGEEIMELAGIAFNWISEHIIDKMHIIKGIIDTTWTGIKIIIDTMLDIILGIVSLFVNLLTGDFEGIQEDITKIWEDLWDGVTAVIDTVLDAAFGWGADLFGGLLDGMKSIWNDISSWFNEKIGWITDKLSFWRDSQEEMGGGNFGLNTSELPGAPSSTGIPSVKERQMMGDGGVVVTGNNFTVREDADITRISREIYNQKTTFTRGTGR